ncbi:hypothetical protein [Yoonia sp. BS5-3]|uniref:Asparagine synthetase domain-containing protein n=1 Tax=Yoonia phaeophyticola TaxID=3137369 RepID=A0ABZ2V395_9RHOB
MISPTPQSLPGFITGTCGGFWVSSGEALRRVPLLDRNGVRFGVCLGIAVDHNGSLPEEYFAENFDSTAAQALDALEGYLPILSGRYALITHLSDRTYFHCDPVGMIGAVYAPETGRVASSTFLCIDRPVEWHPLYDHDRVQAGDGSYGFSHTCDTGVHRMNANHRLELDSLETKRFWPRESDIFSAPESSNQPIYDEIILAIRAIMSRMTTLGHTSLPLSGGNDSRILMALAGDGVLENIDQVFSHINNYANRRDAQVAASLCQAKKVSHEVHDRKKITVKRYIRRLAGRQFRIASGVFASTPKEIENGLFLNVKADSVVMRGHHTNILRGQYIVTSNLKQRAKPDWQIRQMRLAGRSVSKREHIHAFESFFWKYYDDLPVNARNRSVDMMLFETRVPNVLGTLFPGQHHAFFLSPFNSRRLVQISMQPDTAYRLTNAPTTDLLLRADPVLAALPFAYELPADLTETPEAFTKRQSRLTKGLERYVDIFGDEPPFSPDDITPLG